MQARSCHISSIGCHDGVNYNGRYHVEIGLLKYNPKDLEHTCFIQICEKYLWNDESCQRVPVEIYSNGFKT